MLRLVEMTNLHIRHVTYCNVGFYNVQDEKKNKFEVHIHTYAQMHR